MAVTLCRHNLAADGVTASFLTPIGPGVGGLQPVGGIALCGPSQVLSTR
jgi:hypothetical protein